MMRLILIIMIFSVAGCTGNDKNASADNTIADANINGEILFKANCASCHKPDKDFTAPALKGALQRWSGDKNAMYAYVRNPVKSIVENAYAKQLFEKWKTMMTAFNLSDAKLDSIMNYVETYGK